MDNVKDMARDIGVRTAIAQQEYMDDLGTMALTPNDKLIYRVIKRAFDIVASLLGIVLLSPVFIVIAIAIYIDDPGPVLFKQGRIGKHCRVFNMLKFRSMKQNAEELLQQLSEDEQKEFAETFKLKEDPRITKVGKLIRRTSLDELPQLFNILCGQMSIVGPRPPLLVEEDAYGDHLVLVMSVTPGLTGYWQVSGRSDIEFKDRIAMNEYYITHRSLSMDLKIMLKTVKVVFSKEGAV